MVDYLLRLFSTCSDRLPGRLQWALSRPVSSGQALHGVAAFGRATQCEQMSAALSWALPKTFGDVSGAGAAHASGRMRPEERGSASITAGHVERAASFRPEAVFPPSKALTPKTFHTPKLGCLVKAVEGHGDFTEFLHWFCRALLDTASAILVSCEDAFHDGGFLTRAPPVPAEVRRAVQVFPQEVPLLFQRTKGGAQWSVERAQQLLAALDCGDLGERRHSVSPGPTGTLSTTESFEVDPATGERSEAG